jgi:hypothetical protein
MNELIERMERAGQPSGTPSWEQLVPLLRAAQLDFTRVALGSAATATTPESLGVLRSHAARLDLLAERVGPEQARDAYATAGTIYEFWQRSWTSVPTWSRPTSGLPGEGG